MSSSPLGFTADPKADVALVSSDGEVFPVQSSVLEALSEVFSGLFENSANQPGDKDEGTGLPIVKLDETGAQLRMLLKLLVKGQGKSDETERSLKGAETLLQIADKYDFEVIRHIAAGRIAVHAQTQPEQVLGTALRYRQFDLARDALSKFVINRHWIKRAGKEILLELPVGILYRLLELEEKALELRLNGHSVPWASLSQRFEFD